MNFTDFLYTHSEYLILAASIISSLLGAFAAVFSARNLRNRISAEKKLCEYLATSLRKRGIESKITTELNNITLSGTIETDDIEAFKRDIDDALKEAVANLVDEEKKQIDMSLHQPSREGQAQYLKKLVQNSLINLERQQARC